MTQQQMQKEIVQVSAIEGIAVGKIGFISINGFVSVMSDCECISGDKLYDID